MKVFKFILLACILVVTTNCQSSNKNMEQNTVTTFNLDRYLGTWYEIARFDHSFERNLQGVTANYSLREDGKIKVLNQGYKNGLDGELSASEGKAKTTNVAGRLKVSFFWIFYADYLVMELDENYQWALVGSKSDKYLWILSRTPKLADHVKDHILTKAKQRGYYL